MRLAITIGRRKSQETFEVITGPEVSIGDQRLAFPALSEDADSEFEIIELWTSNQGRERRAYVNATTGINPFALLPIGEQLVVADVQPESLTLEPSENPGGAMGVPAPFPKSKKTDLEK